MPSVVALAGKADACVSLVANVVSGGHRSLAEAEEAVAHPLTGVSGKDLKTVCAFLAARVVSLENGVDRDAHLAFVQVQQIVRNYTERHPGP